MNRISATSAIIVGLLVMLIVGATGGLGVGIPYKNEALKAAATWRLRCSLSRYFSKGRSP